MESTVGRPLKAALYFLGLCVMLAHSTEAKSQEGMQVRVAVLNGVKEFALAVRGRYTLTDPLTETHLGQGRRLKTSVVTLSDHGIQIGPDQYPLQRLRLRPQKDVTVIVGNKKRHYRGTLDIIVKENRTFLVVNTLELEQYIKGVLYHEVSNRWPLEATKAQAVAARTYVIFQMKKNQKEAYDVTSDIYSQVYGGKSAERYRTNIAANQTKDEVLFYNGAVLPAYYSATCGGRTEDAKNMWGEDWPPLRGIACDFCVLSPHYRWKRNFRSKDIQDKLNENGYPWGLIKDIAVLERNRSGRIKTLQITTRDGAMIQIPGEKFRNIIGPNVIKSNTYEVFMKGYYFDLAGKGWGHGVGMCQWGAYFMARQRYSYKDILNYYYPGTSLVNYRETPAADLR